MPAPVTGIGPSQALTEMFNLTGKLPLQLDTTIVPTVNLGDLDEEVTWGPQAVAALVLPAGGVGNTAQFEFALPFNTDVQGLRAYVDWVDVKAAAICGIRIRTSPGMAGPTHTATKCWTDTRRRGLPVALLNGQNNAAGTGVAGCYDMELAANEIRRIPLRWIVGQDPDTGLQRGIFFEGTAPNIVVTLNVFWREGAPR